MRKANKSFWTRALTITGIGAAGFGFGVSFENWRAIKCIKSSPNPYVIHATDNIKQVSSKLFD